MLNNLNVRKKILLKVAQKRENQSVSSYISIAGIDVDEHDHSGVI